MPADMLYRIAEYWRQRAGHAQTELGGWGEWIRRAEIAEAAVAKLTQTSAEWEQAAEQWRIKFVAAQALADERGAQLSMRIREEVIAAGLLGPHCIESRVNQHEKCPGCACQCHARPVS